jgi:hypothetical protein
MKWDSEKELAKAIVDELRASGWTVYPELKDIDIVASKPDETRTRGLRVIGIECKKHFNLTVLAQAFGKKRYVDEMYVGVSQGWKNNENFGCQIAKKFGLGVYFVQKYFSYREKTAQYKVKLEVEAELFPRKTSSIEKLFDPEAETFAEAGQAGGKQWSVFKKTSLLITNFVKDNSGKTLKEVVDSIPHHYKSAAGARTTLKKLILKGVIENVRYENDCLFYID